LEGEDFMRSILGLAMVGGVLLGQANLAKAQVSISLGNPYLGPRVTFGQPNYAYGSGYYGQSGYGSVQPNYAYPQPGYGVARPGYPYGGYVTTTRPSYVPSYVAPGTTYYSSGYQGYYNPYATGYRPSVPSYSYPSYYAPQGYTYPNSGYGVPSTYGMTRQFGR